jgi:hypothetical protein
MLVIMLGIGGLQWFCKRCCKQRDDRKYPGRDGVDLSSSFIEVQTNTGSPRTSDKPIFASSLPVATVVPQHAYTALAQEQELVVASLPIDKKH